MQRPVLALQSTRWTMGRHFEGPSTGNLGDRRVLLMTLAVALALRAFCAILFNGEIDGEGAEYARIAENILRGVGYSGIATEGVQLFFPPLFPLLIAGVSMLTGDAEMAGRTVNVLFGTLLVLPVYGIARRMLGEALGLAAAALVAVHPYLVYFSTTVFCESTYLTLVFAAILAAMAASDRSNRRMLAAAGALYGLAYLVRPEAAIFMLVGAASFLLRRALINHGSFAGTARREVRRVGLMLACFVLVAGPYIVWLSQQTGQLRLETKSLLNTAIEMRLQQGLPQPAADYAVSPGLVAEGIWMQPNIDVIRGGRIGISDYKRMFTKERELRDAARIIAGSLEFGSPALFALAVLGMFGRPWRPRVAIDQLHLLILLLLSALALFFIHHLALRFFLLFLVVFCIWAGAGLLCLVQWARLTVSAGGYSERTQERVGRAVAALALAAVLLPPALFATREMLSARGSRPIEALSTGLATGSAALKIADTSTPFAFHARAEFVWLPYCDEGTALKYLAKKQVTHVVVDSDQSDERPYLRSWVQDGVPGAQLVGQARSTNGRFVQVFRLQPTPAP
jgi:4-amino-4-deoxy-L-arabinose transferase-like glycosyltransferase